MTMQERMAEASRDLRIGMERLLPGRQEQHARLERLIERAGRK